MQWIQKDVDFHTVKCFWVSLGKYLQSFGRYSKFCQALGTLDGVFLGESPRNPLRQETADSSTVCVLLKETDLLFTSCTGRWFTDTSIILAFVYCEYSCKYCCNYNVFSDCKTCTFWPECCDFYGEWHWQGGSEQYWFSSTPFNYKWPRFRLLFRMWVTGGLVVKPLDVFFRGIMNWEIKSSLIFWHIRDHYYNISCKFQNSERPC